MTSRAEDWGAHDLDRRFDLGPPRDELTGLAATLDGLLDRIAASRRHEQRFAAEMAHELRTPIAGMRGRAELALGAEAVAEQGRRPALGRHAVGSPDPDRRHAARRRTARARSHRGRGRPRAARPRGRAGRRRRPDGGDLPLAEGEPDVLRRALAPLVANARRHARERVTLELSAGDGPRADHRARRRPRARPGAGRARLRPRRARPGRDDRRARASACRSRGAWPVPAAATSGSATGPAAASSWSCPRCDPSTSAEQSGQRKVACRTVATMTSTTPRGRRSIARAQDVEQGPGGHALLLGHQDHVHHRRRDRRRLPQRQPRLRADQHHLRHRRAARRAAGGPVPAQALRPARVLVGRGRHQRLRHADHRQPHRRARRARW